MSKQNGYRNISNTTEQHNTMQFYLCLETKLLIQANYVSFIKSFSISNMDAVVVPEFKLKARPLILETSLGGGENQLTKELTTGICLRTPCETQHKA